MTQISSRNVILWYIIRGWRLCLDLCLNFGVCNLKARTIHLKDCTCSFLVSAYVVSVIGKMSCFTTWGQPLKLTFLWLVPSLCLTVLMWKAKLVELVLYCHGEQSNRALSLHVSDCFLNCITDLQYHLQNTSILSFFTCVLCFLTTHHNRFT